MSTLLSHENIAVRWFTFVAVVVFLAITWELVSQPWVGLPTADAQSGVDSPLRDPSLRDLETKISTFFDEICLNSGTPTLRPFETLFSGSHLATDLETISAMGKNVAAIPKEFGEPRSAEQVDVRSFGKSRDLIVFRYLLKYDNHPVVWQFTFYRSQGTGVSTSTPSVSGSTGSWGIISVQFDTNLDNLTVAM